MRMEIASVERSDFRDVVESGVYFVDKTYFLKQLIESKRYVTLVTRPRRFGKYME